MAKKEIEKKEPKKRGRPKKSVIPTQKIENRYVIHANADKPPERDYDRHYDKLDINEWAIEHPSPKPKPTPVWKNLPNQNSKEWNDLPYQVRQLNYKPTEDDLNDMPDYFAVMELAKKYPELRAFFLVLGRYMEDIRIYSLRQRCALDRVSDGRMEFKDGLIIQKSCDAMCEEFQRLRKAIKKAKE